MTSSKFVRWGGIASIVTGLSTAAATIMQGNSGQLLNWIYMISTIATVIALSAIYLFQKESAGTLGTVAVVVALVGALLLLFDSLEMIATSIYGLGVILLGFATIRAGRFPSWIGWGWIASLILGIPGFIFPNMQSLFFLLGAIAIAVSFIGAGFIMLSKT